MWKSHFKKVNSFLEAFGYLLALTVIDDFCTVFKHEMLHHFGRMNNWASWYGIKHTV